MSGGDRDNLIERCMRCFKDFPLCEIVTHGLNCKGEMMGSMERFKEFLPSIHDVSSGHCYQLLCTCDCIRTFKVKKVNENCHRTSVHNSVY